MKTKKLTLVSHHYDPKKGFYKPLTLTLNVPDHIWFNADYDIRGKLAAAEKMTIAQFLTTSNESILATIAMATPKQLEKLKDLVDGLMSKRAERVRGLLGMKKYNDETKEDL